MVPKLHSREFLTVPPCLPSFVILAFVRTKMTGRAKSARLRLARKIINRIMNVNPIPQHARHRKTRRKMLPPVDGFPVDYRLLGLPATAFEHGILSDFTPSRC